MSLSKYCLLETALGTCAIAWRDTADGLAITFFQLPEATPAATAARLCERHPAQLAKTLPPPVAQVVRRVTLHLAGKLQDFRDVVLHYGDLPAFAQQVYAAARAIPAGQTVTYGELASTLKRPGASRAIGQALGKNALAILVPCHRILAAGGRPGGFSAHGGLSTKARLLLIEGATLGPPQILRTSADLRRASAQLLELDPRLAPCLKLPLQFKRQQQRSPYESLFTAIVYQQLHGKAAKTILGRVVALFPHAEFPPPAEILQTDDALLRAAGLSANKTAAIKDLAAKTLDGTVPTATEMLRLGDDELVRRLTSIRGVGRWTVEMLLIFTLGRQDVLPVDDFALRKGIAEVLGLPESPTPKQFLALGDAWRPYRTVVSLALWNLLNRQAAASSSKSPGPSSSTAR